MFIHKIDEELALRLTEPQDARRIFELTEGSRTYLREWLPWLDFTQRLEDTQNFIKLERAKFLENRSLNTVILYRGEIVGISGFNSIDHANRIAYIGYWLSADYQGKGIMTRVARALTDYALGELALNKVEIRAAVENERSRAIPERLGYTQEGTIRDAEWLYDHFGDHVIYGALAKDWKAE